MHGKFFTRGVIKNSGYYIQNQAYYIRTLKISRGVNKLLGFITKFLAFFEGGGHKTKSHEGGNPPDPPPYCTPMRERENSPQQQFNCLAFFAQHIMSCVYEENLINGNPLVT